MEGIQEFAERVIENVERVIIGKHAEVELALIALLCGGHVLVEDVPGVGKTSLAKAVARSIGCSFKRTSVYTGHVAQRYYRCVHL